MRTSAITWSMMTTRLPDFTRRPSADACCISAPLAIGHPDRLVHETRDLLGVAADDARTDDSRKDAGSSASAERHACMAGGDRRIEATSEVPEQIQPRQDRRATKDRHVRRDPAPVHAHHDLAAGGT